MLSNRPFDIIRMQICKDIWDTYLNEYDTEEHTIEDVINDTFAVPFVIYERKAKQWLIDNQIDVLDALNFIKEMGFTFNSDSVLNYETIVHEFAFACAEDCYDVTIENVIAERKREEERQELFMLKRLCNA